MTARGVETDRLYDLVSQHTSLEPFGPGWFRGKRLFCGHEDEELTLFRSDGHLRYDCANCGAQGDAGDFEAAMNSENGRTPGVLGGAAVLDAVGAFIRRFVALRDDHTDLIALWVVRTHALDAADTAPYLNIKSAEKRSGKTRLLEVLSLLVLCAWLTCRVSAAVLVREVAAETPTLLLDESDAAFKGDRDYAETLRGVLNAGLRRGGVASLCVSRGKDFDYADFAVFGPKAIAGIGRAPDTVADRATR